MEIDTQQVLELLYDAIEREDWSLVEEATKVIKGESDFNEFETDFHIRGDMLNQVINTKSGEKC